MMKMLKNHGLLQKVLKDQLRLPERQEFFAGLVVGLVCKVSCFEVVLRLGWGFDNLAQNSQPFFSCTLHLRGPCISLPS